MEIKHTPTPWAFDEVPTSCGRCFRIGSPEQLALSKEERRGRVPSYACLYDDYPSNRENEAKANAAFIVRACNMHAEFIAEAKGVIRAMEMAASHAKDGPSRIALNSKASRLADLVAKAEARR